MEKNKIIIRKGTNQDVDAIANLIYCTEVHPDYVWGGESKQESLDNLKTLIKTKGSRYSTEYITVAVAESKVLGAMILIPYDELDRLSIKTDFKQIRKMDGFSEKFYYLITRVKYMLFRECRRGNLYIANIATDEKARGFGIGKKLMKYAEQVAKKEKYEGISLLAKDEKVSKFYEKLDYDKVFDKVLLGERIIKMEKCF